MRDTEASAIKEIRLRIVNVLFIVFYLSTLLQPGEILVFGDGNIFCFKSSPNVADATLSNFVPETVVFNAEFHIIYTDGYHIVIKVTLVVCHLPASA